MEEKKYTRKLTAFIIHGFAVTHAAAAALLAQTMVGDEATLTALTVAMILSIARANKKSWDIGDALSVIGVLAGSYLGTRGALFLVKWIPGIGNAANAVTTFSVTELIGWTTYLLVQDGKKPTTLSKEEKKSLKKEAMNLRDAEREEGKRLFEKMSLEDKEEYDSIMKQLRTPDLPNDTIDYLTNRLAKIAQKYISE